MGDGNRESIDSKFLLPQNSQNITPINESPREPMMDKDKLILNRQTRSMLQKN